MNATDYRPPIEGEPGFMGPSRIFGKHAAPHCEYREGPLDAPVLLPGGACKKNYCGWYVFPSQVLVFRQGAL